MKRLAPLALCLIPAALSAQDDDKGYLTTLIEDNLSGDARTVNIVGFQGALSSEARIAQLTVADSDGVWLTLEDVTLIWTRSALLRGAIDVDQISAARIIVARAPLADDSGPTAEATPFSLPELPVSIALDQLAIDRIELGPDFLGEPLAFGVNGSASLSGGEGDVNIVADRLDGQVGRFEIDGSYANATKVLDILLALDEGPDGVVAGLADLPGQPAVSLNLAGIAPLDDFAATLSLATDGVDRVQGNFGLTSGDTGSRFAVDISGDIAPLLAPDYRDFFGNDVTLVAEGQQADSGFDLETLDLRTQKLRLAGAAALGPDGWPERLALSGAVADDTGDVVLLPIAGADTFVDRVDLNIGYDRTVSDDWTADFEITGFDRPGLYIGSVGVTGGGQIIAGTGGSVGKVTADMTYAATGLELADAGASEALGDAMQGVFELRYTEGAPIAIPRLTLDGPGIELLADATIQGAEDGFETNANVMLSAQDLDRFAVLAGQPGLGGQADLAVIAGTRPLDGTFDVILSGQTVDLASGIAQLDPVLAGAGELSLRAVRDTQGTRLESLRIATPQAVVTADATLTSGASDAVFDISVRDIGLVAAGLDGPATLRGQARRDATGTTEFDISGNGPSVELAASGTVIEAEGRTVNADITASVDDLARYAQLTGQPLDGAIDLALGAVVFSDGARFDATLSGRTQDLKTGVSQLDPLLAGAGQITLGVTRTGADRFRLNTLKLRTDHAQVTASGTVEAMRPAGDFDVSVTDLGLIEPDLSGPARLTGTAVQTSDGLTTFDVAGSGPATRLTAKGQLTDADIPALSADLTANVTDLSRFATLLDRPLSGGIALTASGNALTDGSLFDADLTAATRDLTTGIAQLDPLMTGPGNITARAARTGADAFQIETLTVETAAVTLRANGQGGVEGPAQGQLDLMLADAGLALPGLNGPLSVDFDGSRDVAGVAQVTLVATGIGTNVDLDATVAAPADNHRFDGTLSADIANLAPFAALANQPIAGGLALNLTGSGLPDLSGLDADISIRSDNLRVGIDAADRLLAGIGTVEAEVQRSGDTITVPRFAAQTPQVSASGALETDGSTGQATFAARLANIGLFTDQLSGPVTADGSATLAQTGAWGLDITAEGPGGIGAVTRGSVLPGGDLNLTLTGSAPLGLANTVLDPRRLTGTAAFDLAINGPPALSSVSGRISTAGARLADPSLGQALSDITGGITLTGASASVEIGATVQTGGRLQISGPVGLTAPFDGNLGIALDQVILRDPNLYETSIDGQVTVAGPLTGGARIAGLLTLGETEVQVPSSGIGALGDLPEVIHLGPSGGVQQTLARAGALEQSESSGTGASVAFPLDVTINAPSRIFIRGRGLDAELGGSLTIGGTTANIVPTGQFDLIRGRLDILQQRFELDEGSASVQGDFIPVIRLVATTEATTGTAIQIIVSGPADAPEVTFESTPELPQDEVLSQLIFGRNLSDISPIQAVQLAAAVGTLAGRGGGGLINTFRQGVGLDDLDVTTDADGNAAVRAGAYLSENIYTDVTINSEGDTEINLNLDINSDFTAKGTVDADGETSIGVFFERDY